MAKKQLNVFQRVLATVFPNSKNSIGGNLQDIPLFNRHGPILDTSDFGDILLSDKDLYRGYLYGAIKRRGNRTAQIATQQLKTKLGDDLEAEDHPYLGLIDRSPTFSNVFFWRALSTYLDLQGMAYVLAIRNFTPGGRVGEIQEFKILNPYDISVVKNAKGEIGGYVEQRGTMQRELPLEMVIRIKELNPFDLEDGYAMTDAAKDSQYLNQQASSYTRKSIKKNVGQRGLITTEIIMDDTAFENFKGRVRESGGSADFLFGNGPGAVNYQDMQIDLDKLALDKIKEMSTQELFSVAGVSKTIMSIEVSGTTRETARVQSDLFDSNEIMPQLQIILDALNQDYRNSYVDEFAKSPIELYIDSPLNRDREAEKTDAEILKIKAETAQVLIATGFTPSEVLEQVGMEDMGFEKPEPTTIALPADQPADGEDNKNNQDHHHDDHMPWSWESELNAVGQNDGLSGIIRAKESSLQNSIANIQKKLVMAVVSHIDKNGLTDSQESKIITKTAKGSVIKELQLALNEFSISTVGLFATRQMRKRIEQFGKTAVFKITKQLREFLKGKASQAATSHVDTLLSEIYNKAKELADQNLSRSEIASQLTTLYSDKIATTQATRIARTEANKAWTQSQYQADKQFIEQNELQGKLFKIWVVRSSNPCEFCLELEAETAANPIPFDDAFREVGQSVHAETDGKSTSYSVSYEDIEAGTLHPNCSCSYDIIVQE